MRTVSVVVACALGVALALGASGCCCPIAEPLADALRSRTTVTEPEEDGPPLEDAAEETTESDSGAEADGTYTPPGGVEPQDLVLVIYASETSRDAAEAKRVTYQGQYGDAAPILAVDLSDHYRGLEPGYWIVVSGYRDRETAATDLDWAKQHGIPGYIKPATKLCDDVIEIFELGE